MERDKVFLSNKEKRKLFLNNMKNMLRDNSFVKENKMNKKGKNFIQGFSMQIRNVKCDVRFQDFNNKVVKCILTITGGEFPITQFIGLAKCNIKAGDKFDLLIGQEIALQKAIIKYSKIKTRYVQHLFNQQQETIKYIDHGLGKKFEKTYKS